ncbi:MAG: penicillin-binding protein [Bacteroidetes bacterium]|nr:penicillin-binding protein [Bacteroidota bacterium]
MKDKKKDILWRVYLVYFSVIIFGLTIIGRIIHIQFIEGDIWRNKAKEMTYRYFPVDEMRGSILAADGSMLATSVPIFDLRMDLNTNYYTEDFFQANVDSLSYCLSRLFGDKSRREYKNMIEQAYKESDGFLLLKRNVTYSQLKKVRTFPIFRLGRYKGGLVVVEKSRRELPFKMLASRTIGFEREGVNVGLEGGYNKYLRGVSGRVLMRTLSNGAYMPVDSKTDIEPKDGNDIVTTLDVTFQDVAEDALTRCLIANEADHGCAILMEVKTGEIRAIANLTRMEDGSYAEMMNYAISEASEPGSTFKLPSLMVALEDKVIDLNDTVDTEGGRHWYFSQLMRDSHAGGYGRISVKKAFELSSNVGISKIIYKSYYQNPQAWVDGLYRMSLNKPLELDINGEARPIIKSTKNPLWSKFYSLAWMSVGYEVAVTPLQILTFYNAVANDGVMVKPMFVREIRESGLTIESFEPQIINKAICSKSTIKMARQILEGVVKEGTAKNLFSTVYQIAGKTGTAQIANEADGYDHVNYKASFVGYFPADHPKYSCIVVVNNPTKGVYYGGAVAAPVFKEIADKVYATTLDIHQENEVTTISKDIPKVLAANRYDIGKVVTTLGFTHTADVGSVWLQQVADSTRLYFRPKSMTDGAVPDVTGMSAKDAVFLMEKNGLRVRILGKGAIKRQSLLPGTKAAKNTLVTLELATL